MTRKAFSQPTDSTASIASGTVISSPSEVPVEPIDMASDRRLTNHWLTRVVTVTGEANE